MPLMPPVSQTLPALVREQAQRFGSHEVLVDANARLTYADFELAVNQCARGLLGLGVQAGDRVAICMGNRNEWVVAAFAITAIGAVMVGVNTWLSTPELGYVLRHSGTRTLLAEPRFLRHDYAQSLAALRAETQGLPALREVVWVGEPPADLAPGDLTWAALQQTGHGVSAQQLAQRSAAVRPEDDSFLLYTSGSTSLPKGVVLQHDALIANMWQIGARQHNTSHDRLWLAVSLFWGLGCENALFNMFTRGGCLVLQPHFDAEAALALIERERCTLFYGTPNMAQALLDAPGYAPARLASLRGGATIGSPEQIQRLVDAGCRDICNIYGLTETYGNCNVTDAAEPLHRRLRSVGRALEGVTVRIVNPETEALCQADEVGEIRVKGYVFKRYHNDPEATRAAFDDDGFFRTGDLGWLDAEGYLYFRGRLKEMVKVGGMNVAPVEVEEVLLQHPLVLAAYCTGLAQDDDFVLGAVLVARAGATPNTEAVRRHCQGRLARYKQPQHIVWVSDAELPLTTTGKVKKNQLPELFVRVASSR
jgi:fatty-acyl-CoA synthase